MAHTRDPLVDTEKKETCDELIPESHCSLTMAVYLYLLSRCLWYIWEGILFVIQSAFLMSGFLPYP